MEASPQVSAPAADFVDGIIQLSYLKEEAKNELLDILTNIRGRKCLIVDNQVEGLLNQVVTEGPKFFKENGIHLFRELKTDFSQLIQDVSRDAPDHFVYLVHPHVSNMKIIAQQISGLANISNRFQFLVFFVPGQSTVCVHLLEEYIGNVDLLERVRFRDFKMGLIPFDSDILTLENDFAFKELYSGGDLSSLSMVAHALQKMQTLFGVIPNVKVKGPLSKRVLQQMLHLRKEEENFLDRDQASGAIVRRAEIDTLLM